ncbi:MAG: hypothetical protein SYC29_14890 [Planctomycetota bacterium]|nr:hypothetical protein [Planctomycetota bacterium]
MSEQRGGAAGADVFFMIISALLFAWFGFRAGWAHQYTTTQPPQLLVMVVILKWTLRIGAILFGLSALQTIMGLLTGEVLYSLTGLVTAIIFIVVAIWEWTNPQGYYSGVSPFLLVIFAVWNGYGSLLGLRAVRLTGRPAPEHDDRPQPR